MSPIDIFLWGVYPYIALTILVVGTIMRRVFFPRTWTSKSSQFLEAKNEMIGTPIFHLMLLFVVFGHLGMFIPKEVMDSMGVNEHMYHMAAFYMGGGAGVVLGLALILLIRRRFGIKRMKANTSKMDIVLYVLMTLTIVLGICATFSNADGSFEYRLSLTPWVRSIFIGQPLVAQMAISPLIYKVHIFCGLTFFAVLPFTRIVHMFSGITAGFKYVGRKAIVYRRRKIEERALANERALEFPARVTPSDK